MRSLKKETIFWKSLLTNPQLMFPAPNKGRLIEILIQEGDVVTIGDTIAIIESEP